MKNKQKRLKCKEKTNRCYYKSKQKTRSLINKGIYKEILDQLVKQKFHGIKELTYEIHHDDLRYNFKGDSAKKIFDDFDNVVEHFRKIQSGEMKLEDAKELQNIFTSNLKNMPRGRLESKDRQNTLKNIKLLYESRQTVIKLFNYYSSISSEAKHKAKYRKELKILSPKQMLQRLPIVYAQVKASNTFENLLNETK